MQKLLLFVDRVSTWVGQAFAWLIVALTLLISWEVFSRYVLDSPHSWTFDLMIMMYGTLFMMAGAYTLAKNGHVRGDVLYGFFPPRLQAGLDLALYIVFFIPGVVALAYAGYNYAADSWAINEHSSTTADGPPLYWFKTVIPIAGGDDPAAGPRRNRALRDLPADRANGRRAMEDVEEVDVDKLKQMVHVKDEDIAGARQVRDRAGRTRTRGPPNEKGRLVRPLDHGADRGRRRSCCCRRRRSSPTATSAC